MAVRVSNIVYDTDGEDVPGLPTELTLPHFDPAIDDPDDLADFVSEHTGWCVSSLDWEELH